MGALETLLVGIGLVVAIVIGLILYVYMALCLMFIAQKTGTKYPWLAWIPIANVFLMAMIAKKPWWWALIVVIAFGLASAFMRGDIGWLGWVFEIVGLVFMVLIWIDIFRARNRPAWWVVLMFIPIVNLVIIGITAFSA